MGLAKEDPGKENQLLQSSGLASKGIESPGELESQRRLRPRPSSALPSFFPGQTLWLCPSVRSES